jgi:hypothetical protein
VTNLAPIRKGSDVRKYTWIIALALLGLGFQGSPLWAQERNKAPAKKPPESYEEVLVPAKRFDVILKRFPKGLFLRAAEWRRLLERAGKWRPEAKAVEDRAAVSVVISSCHYKGTVHAKEGTITFVADAAIHILNKGWQKIPLPTAGIVMGLVTVDGQDAQIVPHGPMRSALLLSGKGLHKLRYEFTVKLRRNLDGPGGHFDFGLLRASAGTLEFDLSGRMSVTTNPPTSSVRFVGQKGSERSYVSLAHGSVSKLSVKFEPEEIKVRKAAYVVADKVTLFDVGQAVVVLHGQIQLRISRQELDSLRLQLPRGFTMRTLSAEASPSWIQRARLVSINLAEARSDTYRVTFTAERAVKPGKIDLEPVRVLTAARETGLIAFHRRPDVKIKVLAEQRLQRRDEVVMQRVRPGRYDRVYSETPVPFMLSLRTRSVTPKVKLNISALYEFEDYELKSQVIYRYIVTEGNIFSIRALIPKDHEVDGVQVWASNQHKPNYDLRVRKVDGTYEVAVELEQGVPAGQQARIVVNIVRSLPEGLKTMKTIPFPVFGGSPAESIDGFLGFAITSEYSLRGEQIQGLTAVPAKEMVRIGIDHTNLVLGYRVDHAEHGGRFKINHRRSRLSVKSLLSHTVADQVVTTRALLAFEVKGAPTRQLILFLPKGKGANAHIDGPAIKERGLVKGPVPEAHLERFRVRFLQPVEGSFQLFLEFDTPITAFHSTGAASSSFSVPKIHVADIERESGVVAIYSSDSTQLTAKTSGLRPIEVTAVPKHRRIPTIGRPLLAYNYVRPEFELELVVRRYKDGEVLTALCEHLSIDSSVGVDGVIRNTASFRLKNLSHQFLSLQLPKKAKLWSVIVDKVGVKPALNAKDAHIIPLPLRSSKSKDGVLQLTVVYDQRGGDLMNGQSAHLKAPALLIPSSQGDERVPVLATGWSLAVPGDNRIVSVTGNLKGLPEQLDRLLMVHLSNQSYWFWKRNNVTSWLIWLAVALFSLWFIFKLMIKPLFGRVKENPKLILVFGGVALAALIAAGIFTLSMMGGRSERTGYAPAQDRLSSRVSPSRYSGDSSPNNRKPGIKIAKSESGNEMPAEDAPTDGLSLKEDRQDSRKKSLGRKNAVAQRQLRNENKKARETAARSQRKPMKRSKRKRDTKPRPQRLPQSVAKPEPEADPRSRERLKKPAAPSPAKAQTLRPSGKRPKPGSGHAGGRLFDGDKPPTGTTTSPDKAGALLDRFIREGEVTSEKDMSRLLEDQEAAREGVRSLVFLMPAVGHVYTLSRRGGQAWLDFELLNESNYRNLAAISLILGFLAALIVPYRWKRFTYLGLFLLVAGLGTALAMTFSTASLVAASNGAIAGFGMAGVVHLFLFLMGRLSKLRSKSHASRPQVRVIASFLLIFMVLGFGPAAQADNDKRETVRVYVPYKPKTMEAQDRVYVPQDLFKEIMSRAYPKAEKAAPVLLPAPYAFGKVSYEARLSGARMDLDINFSVRVFAAWTELPLNLKGIAIRFDEDDAVRVLGGDSKSLPRLRQKRGRLSMIFEKPGTYQVTLRSVVARKREGFVFTPIPVGAAQLLLRTSDLKNRILLTLKEGGQTEKIVGKERQIRAFLGHQGRVQIVVTPPEVLSLTGSSDASAQNITLFALDDGVIRVFSHIKLDVVGSGWEGFRFRIPRQMSVVKVIGTGLREWRTVVDSSSKQRVLELFLRQARSGKIEFQIEAEMLLADGVKSAKLPEIVSLGVKREYGVVALAPAAGMKIRTSTTGSFFQISPQQAGGLNRLISKIPGRQVDRAYSYGSRPTGLTVTFVKESTVMKARTRVLGVVSTEDYQWRARVDFTVTKGRAHELAFQIPRVMSCDRVLVQGRSVRDWRIEMIEKQSYVVCNLQRGLSGRFSVQLFLRRAVHKDRYQLAVPDLRPMILERNPELRFIKPRSDEGAIVLAVKDGLNLLPLEDFQGWDPVDINQERHWLSLNSRQEVPRLAYTIKSRVRYGQIEVSRQKPLIRGAFTMHAQVFHEVVRYRVHMAYEIERSGARFFSFLLPTRFGDHIDINAPNRRELTVLDVALGDKTFKEYRIELQSAVRGLYEMTFEIEDLAGKDGKIQFPELIITKVARSRGYILVEKDAQVHDNLLLESKSDVEKIDAGNVPALPPGRTPYSFIAAYKVQQPQSGVTDWTLSYRLKKVRRGQGRDAIIDWVRLTSVIHADGRIQNKARYRVSNRRLQFLKLKMPEGTHVWSLRVAGKAKRVYEHADGSLLLPLPKRVEADLSFDVEVMYETHLGKALSFMTSIRPLAPTVVTKGLTPEQSHWSVYVPEEFNYFQIKTNMNASFAAEQQTNVAQKAIEEISVLAQVADKDGQSAQIFDDNVIGNLAIVGKVLKTARTKQGYALEQSKKGLFTKNQIQEVARNGVRLQQLETQWGDLNRDILKQRRVRAGKRRQGRSQLGNMQGQQVKLGGNNYMQSFSNEWCLNPSLLKNKRANWEGISNESKTQMENLALFALNNYKVQKQIRLGANFKGKGNSINRAKLLNAYQQELQRGQSEFNDRSNDQGDKQLDWINTVEKEKGGRKPAALPSSGFMTGAEADIAGVRKRKEGAYKDTYINRGLLSMQVDIGIVGVPYHFVKDQGKMELSLTAVPRTFFSKLKAAIQILAVLSLLLLIPYFSAFDKSQEIGILHTVFSVCVLLTLVWIVSLGWFSSVSVFLGMLIFKRLTRD